MKRKRFVLKFQILWPPCIWSQGEHLYQGMETSFSLNEMFDCMKEIKANDIKLFGLYIDSDLFFALIKKFSSKSLVFDKWAFKENHEIKGDVINTLPKISFINWWFNSSYSIENKRNKPLKFDRYKRLMATRNWDIFFNKFLRKIKRESDLENIEIIYSFGLKEFLVSTDLQMHCKPTSIKNKYIEFYYIELTIHLQRIK